jgi:hypothetical protein
MIVTPVAHGLDLLKSDLVRSPGLHASDIYGDLYQQLEPNRYKKDQPLNAPLMALGTAWEKHLEYLLLINGAKVYRPGELMSSDGIAFSPDLIMFNGHTRVGEIKLSSMSAESMPVEETNNLPPKFDKYLAQMKLYAYWLELRHGWLAMLSIYRPHLPELRCFNLEWSERELQENWQMHDNHSKHEGMR